MITAEKIIEQLQLKPLPHEGGYFAETYRDKTKIPDGILGSSYQGGRSLSTSIYYLLTPDTFSAMHRLPGVEIYHFYMGDPIEMLQLNPDGSGEKLTIGLDIEAGMFPQFAVPENVWQGSRLVAGGRFALLGTTMSPGFEFKDYDPGDRQQLLADYPMFADAILELTRVED